MLLDQPSIDLDLLTTALRSHIEMSEALLAELRESPGGKRMATLGFQYGRIAEARPESAPHRPGGPELTDASVRL